MVQSRKTRQDETGTCVFALRLSCRCFASPSLAGREPFGARRRRPAHLRFAGWHGHRPAGGASAGNALGGGSAFAAQVRVGLLEFVGGLGSRKKTSLMQ